MLYRAGYTHLHAHDGSEKMLEIARKRGVFEQCIHQLLMPNQRQAHLKLHFMMPSFVSVCIRLKV